MMTLNQVKKHGARVVSAVDHAFAKAAVLAVTTLGAASAFAQTAPDPFDAAMTSATTKVGTYAAALVGLAAVSVVFMIGMKYVKRIPRAS